MNNEYQKALYFVGNKLMGDGLDSFKPVNAHFANQLAQVALLVAQGKTLEEAIKEVES